MNEEQMEQQTTQDEPVEEKPKSSENDFSDVAGVDSETAEYLMGGTDDPYIAGGEDDDDITGVDAATDKFLFDPGDVSGFKPAKPAPRPKPKVRYVVIPPRNQAVRRVYPGYQPGISIGR